MDKSGILFSWQKSNRIEKRKQDSDDEQDDLLDETGEKESKRMRLEALRSKKVDNLDTLTEHLDELKVAIDKLTVELDQIDKEMNASKSGSNKDNNDELDQYMQTVSTVSSNYSLNDLKIKKSKSKMKMSQLIKDKERTERLIKIAQPSATTFKSKSQSSTASSSKAIELIQKAQAKLNQKKQEEATIVLDDESNDDKNVKIIEVNLNKNDEKHETNSGAIVVVNDQPIKTSLFTFSKPTAKKMQKSFEFNLDDEENADKEKGKRPILIDLDEEDIDINRINKKPISSRFDLDEVESINRSKIDKSISTIKSSQPVKVRNQILINRRDEDEVIEEDNFVEWLPPEEENQTVDKRSHLNDKYGY